MSKLVNFAFGAATAVGTTFAAGDALATTFCMHSDGNPKTIAQHISNASSANGQLIWNGTPSMGKNDGCCIYQMHRDGSLKISDVTNGVVGPVRGLPSGTLLNKCPMPGR